ncbi:WecB/TagA/CpsF family glycosyltransferase [Pseudomonas vancouverensis]|uniref:Glycosyltransferase n=1 Tax=Pseudomonas vancouverensis TaxID=95300 RepID=A0A1H2NFZ5_PSEVA|nr:WecB/TagA/CpsF family glycosyltransferase [Pseudomonas vancouverensis]KAB0494295.1 WecB/TagA/CpsF family glycosyltransferase [Pseudomonas vancouverensis]TDB60603.1 glycosyltransferase [Pseudomonas vancouverensis]SDV04111.1 N-acetylglucosaminyldiphosphoundecaprenol N-acetyl-beta-D-mannosaminyltransferase [Pseudomonas vancouverensis]
MIRLELIGQYSPALLDANMAFSFINFASIGSFFQQPPHAIAYFCDGMLMSSFMSRVTGRAIDRVSFDFTSIADPVFSDAEKLGKRVYLVGATQAELELFVQKLHARYPRLAIAGYHNGYFDAAQAAAIYADISLGHADILIVGLGAGLQERFVLNALDAGFSGVAFTCGAFIRQEALATNTYYPEVINRLHLRAFYRMYREPHTIERYLLDYPSNFLRLAALILQRKVAINITAP